MPPNEELAAFAAHGTTMALFLSVRRPRELQADLLAGGYAEDTPCAVVYRASWPDEIVIRCPLAELGERVRAARITTQALVLVGPALGEGVGRSHVYDAGYGHRHRPLGRPDRYKQRVRRARFSASRRAPHGPRRSSSAPTSSPAAAPCSRRSPRHGAPRDARERDRGDGRGAARGPGASACWPRAIPASSASSRAFGDAPLEIHPAPSSVALAFARLGLPWDDALVVSAHARDPRPAIHTALRHPKVAILTDDNAAEIVAALEGRSRDVAEALGTPAERVASEPPFAQPNVVIVERRRARAARELAGRCPRMPSSTAPG